MICQNCKTNLQGDFKFCPSCGAPAAAQKGFCPGCGKETEANWLACPHCGQRFNSPSVSVPHQQNTVYEPKHGYHRGSGSGHLFGGHSGKHHRRKGFLGSLFSS
jgi:predicted amidophosphoribosyltransferase